MITDVYIFVELLVASLFFASLLHFFFEKWTPLLKN
jgi:hypothetical protein